MTVLTLKINKILLLLLLLFWPLPVHPFSPNTQGTEGHFHSLSLAVGLMLDPRVWDTYTLCCWGPPELYQACFRGHVALGVEPELGICKIHILTPGLFPHSLKWIIFELLRITYSFLSPSICISLKTGLHNLKSILRNSVIKC